MSTTDRIEVIAGLSRVTLRPTVLDRTGPYQGGPYRHLNDAQGKSLCAGLAYGATEVWYAFTPTFMVGPFKPRVTHQLLGMVAGDATTETDRDALFVSLQGEAWSPEGEAREFILGLGLDHTSMSVGDVLVTPTGEAWMCAPTGWERV